MIAISLFLNILITAAIYLFIPIIFILIGHPFSRTKINLISFLSFIIGLIISALFFQILYGDIPLRIGGGSLLWTAVGNWLMREKIACAIDPADIKQQKKDEARNKRIESAINSGVYKSVEEYERHEGFLGLAIIGLIFIVFLAAVIIFGGK